MSQIKLITKLFVIMMLLGLFSVSSAQVIEGDVTLSTQAEVNSFAGTSITGSLTIQGSDIIDLTPLSTLTSVGGDLYVYNNDTLTNLDGLSNFTSVGGWLSVYNNDALTNLDGLGNLTSVGGYLWVASNLVLTNLDGLGNLTSVGSLSVGGNAALTNLDGLGNLTSVGSLYIAYNDYLNSFCGLWSLLSSGGLGGSYSLSNNAVNPTQQQIIDDGPCLTTAIAENGLLPKDYSLQQNYPNPFNPSTTISYDLSEQSTVSLTVYDVRGQEITTLQNGVKAPGNYKLQWNGMDQSGNPVSTGVYFCRLQAGAYSKTIKMIFLK